MIRLQPHKRDTFAGTTTPGTKYTVRIPGPVGEQAANIRGWTNVYRRSAAASVKLILRHSPIPDAATYESYATVVDPGSSSATGLNSGFVDTDPTGSNGRPGAFLEAELWVIGTSGAVDVECETFLEISPL